MELNQILQAALAGHASDIHLKAGLPPMLRIDGNLVPLKGAHRLEPDEVARMAFGMMHEHQQTRFKQTNEVDLAYGVSGLGRFRVNVFQQRGAVGAVLRVIPFKVQSFEQLMLPKVIEKLAAERRGLLLVTGTTGCGKSTTLAAMVEHINSTETCHIMTIEDPIEYLFRDKRSVVNQREVGLDTLSFAQALTSALRQDPDVILVGEMRDLETMETALNAAETGHLVMSTLHTVDAAETVQRVISTFPPHQQKQIRLQLASVLRGVISQRLVPRADGRGRVPAIEVLVATARVRELIGDADRTKQIPEAIAAGHVSYGMQTFDQSLMALLNAGLISYQEAIRQATNPDDFALRVSGVSATSDPRWDGFEKSGAPAPAVAAAPAPPAARPAPPAARPAPAAARPAPTVVGRIVAPAPAKSSPDEPLPDDDFAIERF